MAEKRNYINALPPGTDIRSNEYVYRIERVLGQGTFGITYLASTTVRGPLGQIPIKVAIKEFFMRDVNGREGTSVSSSSQSGEFEYYKNKFRNEARNLSRLNHPNIVKVLDAFESNDTVYYSMEYLENGSLDDFIDRTGPIDEKRALAMAGQIASALECMHSQRMLHLDLKPGNIMMRDADTVTLIDFGLSKQYDRDGSPASSTTIGGGTPGYAPLEQMNYREGRGFPVTMDVYALGGTMFRMLTGDCPPDAADILNDGFPYDAMKARGISDDVITAVSRAMSPARADRTPTPGAVIEMARGVAVVSEQDPDDGNPTVIGRNTRRPETAGRETVVIPGNSGKTRSGRLTVIILTTVMALAIGIGAYIFFSPASPPESPAPSPMPYSSTISYKSALGMMDYDGPVDPEGRPDGVGSATFMEGRVRGCKFEGTFSHGTIVEGVWVLPDGDWFDGTFKDGQYDRGKYTITSGPDRGQQYEGTFKDSQPDRGTWRTVDLNTEKPHHVIK